MALEDKPKACVCFDKLSRAIKTKENFMSLFFTMNWNGVIIFQYKKYQEILMGWMVDGSMKKILLLTLRIPPYMNEGQFVSKRQIGLDYVCFSFCVLMR